MGIDAPVEVYPVDIGVMFGDDGNTTLKGPGLNRDGGDECVSIHGFISDLILIIISGRTEENHCPADRLPSEEDIFVLYGLKIGLKFF